MRHIIFCNGPFLFVVCGNDKSLRVFVYNSKTRLLEHSSIIVPLELMCAGVVEDDVFLFGKKPSVSFNDEPVYKSFNFRTRNWADSPLHRLGMDSTFGSIGAPARSSETIGSNIYLMRRAKMSVYNIQTGLTSTPCWVPHPLRHPTTCVFHGILISYDVQHGVLNWYDSDMKSWRLVLNFRLERRRVRSASAGLGLLNGDLALVWTQICYNRSSSQSQEEVWCTKVCLRRKPDGNLEGSAYSAQHLETIPYGYKINMYLSVSPYRPFRPAMPALYFDDV
ncbi:PREDICTED: putative F-box/kelch-repeat protein At1g60570 [Camelina sativa]|uniref:F-box/kelch-repeat protein At1g60570 n=1 Tax=Camelina sativa TaxID=90675 RepID=A0ABM0SZY9_CAMSA|nr:PREDICTED: putative F-box/kelch-repeat protein At1g60570 [Camelina sativa]